MRHETERTSAPVWKRIIIVLAVVIALGTIMTVEAAPLHAGVACEGCHN